MADLPEVTAPAKSVSERLRESFVRSQAVKTQDIAIPGYDELHVIFRVLDDYTELRRVLRGAQLRNRHLPESAQEIQASIETLILASVDSYAVVDGQRIDIGLPLGLALYDYIFPVSAEDPAKPSLRPTKDGEAVTMLFGSTVALMFVASQLDVVSKMAAITAETELPGES